jgi:hypothetical protein
MQQKVNARDTRFIPEVRPTTKVAYISVEELTKSRIFFNPNPPKLPKGQLGAHYQSPQRGG